jgi:L-asparagine transporter-like permease
MIDNIPICIQLYQALLHGIEPKKGLIIGLTYLNFTEEQKEELMVKYALRTAFCYGFLIFIVVLFMASGQWTKGLYFLVLTTFAALLEIYFIARESPYEKQWNP